jgi:hypothetical protein
MQDPHFGQGVDYVTDACGVAHLAPGLCYGAIEFAPGAEKEFDSPNTVGGDPFAVYRGIECDLFQWESYEQRAKDSLALSETRGVEEGFRISVLEGDGLADLTPTPGTAIKPVEAFGILEEYAGNTYSGKPLIHVGRYGATYLGKSGVIKDQEGDMVTFQQTPVVNGSGYGRGTGVPATGRFWVWMTGQVGLWRGPVISNRVPDPRYNTARGIAERIYVAAADCFVVGVLVTTEGI